LCTVWNVKNKSTPALDAGFRGGGGVEGKLEP